MRRDTPKPKELSDEEIEALVIEKSELMVAEVNGNKVAKARTKEINQILQPLVDQVVSDLTGSPS